MRIVEKAFFLLAIVGIIMKCVSIPGSSILLTLSVLVLACIYLFFSFALLNGISLRNIFKKEAYKGISGLRIVGSIVVGYILSTTCCSVLFGIQIWPGRKIMLLTGVIDSIPLLIISIIGLWGEHKKYYSRIMARLFIPAALCLFFLFFPI